MNASARNSSITPHPTPQGTNRSGPGAIGGAGELPQRLSSDSPRRPATLRPAGRLLAACVVAGAAGFWASFSPPLALVYLTEAAAALGIEFLARALPVLATILLPFPLAGALAVAAVCAVATWPPASPHRPAAETPHDG